MLIKSNRKGFTLIELLAVIIIISVLITVAGIGIIRILSKSKDDTIKEQIKQLQDAAVVYAVDQVNKSKWYFGPCDTEASCKANNKTINVSVLLGEYFEDKAGKCDKNGIITIYRDTKGDFQAEVAENTCTNK